jgi:hypothetical protein
LVLIRLAVQHGSEAWTSDENTLALRETKILRKISGPAQENDVWRIRTNQELMNLCKEKDKSEKLEKKDYNA